MYVARTKSRVLQYYGEALSLTEHICWDDDEPGVACADDLRGRTQINLEVV